MQRVTFSYEMSEEAKQEKEHVVQKLLSSATIHAWNRKYQKDADFVARHAYKFKDYVARKQLCADCKGLSMCMQPSKGYILEMEAEGALLTSKLQPCTYRQQKESALAHRKQFSLCDMSEEQLLYSFDHIDYVKEGPAYLALVKEMIEASKKERSKGFYLCAEPGAGKTFLACCFVNEKAKEGKRCAFVNMSSYFSVLKTKMYDKDAFQKQIDALRKADVAVLDDIAGESVSNWSRDEILLPILNERMENKLTTLFTSNYDMRNIEQFYALNSKLVNDKVGAKRLVERMKALSLEKVLNCGNRRAKKD